MTVPITLAVMSVRPHAAKHATPALTARGAVGAGGARRAGGADSSACRRGKGSKDGPFSDLRTGPTVICENAYIQK
jgi:hypothetical protein